MDIPLLLPSHLASLLRARRKSLGLTQAQAGARVGLLPKTVSSLENHPERSSLDSLFKLISALELELYLVPRPDAASHAGEW